MSGSASPATGGNVSIGASSSAGLQLSRPVILPESSRSASVSSAMAAAVTSATTADEMSRRASAL
ncbi:hypothetical protein [Actinoplanes sp. L3-i22]|uniref:hypothetical protein n=1 Tax=Actinoplanes sp. L3-i22 TaxID=2836373 RepID=UPI001C84E14C|nr:hypothetical protein [Actinoplanes sp. L3-i22]